MDIEIPESALPKNNGGGDGDFSPIPDGPYAATIAESKMVDMPSGKGLKITYKISEGEHSGRQILENYPMAENCRWKLVQLLNAAGIDITKGVVKGFKASNLLGSPVRLKVGTKTYNDKEYNEVRFVDPPPGGVAGKKAKQGFSLA